MHSVMFSSHGINLLLAGVSNSTTFCFSDLQLCFVFDLNVKSRAFFMHFCTGVLCVLIQFILLSGNTNSIFALDYISGALTLNGPLDRENPFYSAGFILTVKVRESEMGCIGASVSEYFKGEEGNIGCGSKS